MKTLEKIFAIVLFIVSGIQLKAEEVKTPWWPQDKADLPELVAFAEVFGKRYQSFNGPLFDLPSNFAPAVLFDAQGKPTHFETLVGAVRKAPESNLKRQLTYHGVWREPMSSVFHNKNIWRRTRAQNEKLIEDYDEYVNAVKQATLFVNQSSASNASEETFKFLVAIDEWHWGEESDVLPQTLTSFVRNFDEFFLVLETKAHLKQSQLYLFVLNIDYTPYTGEISVELSEGSGVLVYGIPINPDAGKRVLVYQGPIPHEDTAVEDLARQVFTKLIVRAPSLSKKPSPQRSL